MESRPSVIERMRYRWATDKKRVVMAMCLVGIMLFMWGRLLMKKGPEEASAATSPEDKTTREQENADINVTFVPLPHVPGRHDVINRNFFASAGWRGFGKETEVQNDKNSEDVEVAKEKREEIVAGIQAALKLHAVVQVGPRPQASIGGNHEVVVGDVLTVDVGSETYECEVAAIEEGQVHLRCGNLKVLLKVQSGSKQTDD